MEGGPDEIAWLRPAVFAFSDDVEHVALVFRCEFPFRAIGPYQTKAEQGGERGEEDVRDDWFAEKQEFLHLPVNRLNNLFRIQET